MNQDLIKILAAEAIEDVWQILLARLNRYGFTSALYAFTQFKNEKGFGDLADNLVLTNLGDAYVHGYLIEERYKHAPLIKWATDNVGSVPWSYIDANFDTLSDKERETVAFNRAFGLRAGYTLSFPSNSKRARGGIGMTVDSQIRTQEDADAIWRVHGSDIEILCGVAHIKIISLPFTKRILTKRQREVLEWVGEGKTNADVAQIMGLTLATVDKHLRLARAALNVETTAQALLKASLHNQIYAQ